MFALIAEAGVECRLAATGLLLIVRYGATCFFQHLYHVECGLREKLVYKAGNENLNVHQSNVRVIFFGTIY